MNANRYARLRALADDPRTPEHERSTARLRCQEFEAAHPEQVRSAKQAPRPRAHWTPPPPSSPRDICAHCPHGYQTHEIGRKHFNRPCASRCHCPGFA